MRKKKSNGPYRTSNRTLRLLLPGDSGSLGGDAWPGLASGRPPPPPTTCVQWESVRPRGAHGGGPARRTASRPELGPERLCLAWEVWVSLRSGSLCFRNNETSAVVTFPKGSCACILSSDCALPVRGGARARCRVPAEGRAPGGDRCGQELGSDRAAAGPGVGGASRGPASVAGRPVVSLRVALCSWSSLSCVGERQRGPELTLACQFRQGQGSWTCRVCSVLWEASGTSS